MELPKFNESDDDGSDVEIKNGVEHGRVRRRLRNRVRNSEGSLGGGCATS